jgi:Protein of unknown function (DUF3631)
MGGSRFAIAELAGDDWRRRAENAARALSGHETAEDGSIRIKLLADAYAVFAEQKVERLSSDDIVAYLVALEGRPWPEFGKERKQISKTQVADLLRPLHITPTKIRVGEKTPRGYGRAAFADAFSRFLPHLPPLPLLQNGTPERSEVFCGLESNFRVEHEASLFHPENGQDSSNSAICSTVPPWNPPRGVEEKKGPALEEPDLALHAIGVPFMITAAMRRGLHELGYSDEAIRTMTPAEARRLLGDGAGRDEGVELPLGERSGEPQAVSAGRAKRSRITL